MDRKYLLKKIMREKKFLNTVSLIRDTLGEKFPISMIGGFAVGHYSNPPKTFDVDFIIDSDRYCLASFFIDVELEEFWPWKIYDLYVHPFSGFVLESKKRSIMDVDILFSEIEAYKHFIHKAIINSYIIDNLKIRVVNPNDLTVLKSLAGREKDERDILEMQKAGIKLDNKYIDSELNKLL